MKQTKIILTLPPSDNRRFVIARHLNRLVKSALHRQYKKIVGLEFMQYKHLFPKPLSPTYEKQLFIDYKVYLKDKRRDGSNCEKVLKDSLSGLLYDDDKWVNLRAMRIEIDKVKPRVELYLGGDTA